MDPDSPILAEGTNSPAPFMTLLRAIKYPLGDCLGAGSSSGHKKTLGTCWVLPFNKRSDLTRSNSTYQVCKETYTAGPRCIKVQNFRRDRNNNNILRPNGAAWAGVNHLPSSAADPICFDCMFMTLSSFCSTNVLTSVLSAATFSGKRALMQGVATWRPC